MENNGNGRVTMAVLATKLDALTDEVRGYHEMLCERVDDHEQRIRVTEVEIAQIGERQRISTGILATLQVIIGAVATWLGVRN